MSTDLVVRSTDVPEAFDAQMRMAAVVADSSLLPGHLRGKAANVLLVLMGARTLNISAFQALQSIFVVEGKLSISADMMRALMTRAGHRVRVVERTAKRAIVEVHRHDRETPYRAEFTYEDAVAAKLVKKENYEKYLKAMLVARATSIAWRDECADVAYGVSYTPEELGAKVNADGGVEVDNEGKVVLDGETVEPVSDETVAAWAELLLHGDLVGAVLPAWEHIQARRARDRKPVDLDTSLAQLMGERLIAAGDAASTKEELTEVWRMAKLVNAMEIVTADGVVHEELAARAKAIALAAEQDAAAETPPPVPVVIDVDLDEITAPERPEYTADPEVVAAALGTWDVNGEADSDDQPA